MKLYEAIKFILTVLKVHQIKPNNVRKLITNVITAIPLSVYFYIMSVAYLDFQKLLDKFLIQD